MKVPKAIVKMLHGTHILVYASEVSVGDGILGEV